MPFSLASVGIEGFPESKAPITMVGWGQNVPARRRMAQILRRPAPHSGYVWRASRRKARWQAWALTINDMPDLRPCRRRAISVAHNSLTTRG
jgi:hypothetical protein